MKTRRADYVIGCLSVLLAAALWFDTSRLDQPHYRTSGRAVEHATHSEGEESATAAEIRNRPIPAEPERAALTALGPAEEGHSPLADKLNAPDRTIGQDLAVVLTL